MAKRAKRLHSLILDVLQAHPDGLTIHEIREKLPSDVGPQEELNKRVRELRYEHDIPHKKGKYYYRGARAAPVDNQGIGSRLRAAVLSKAHGRCQMCGRTVERDRIKLQADHKVPRNWGGTSELENLWAICDLCNSGKRDFFSSFDPALMSKLVEIDSVHRRLAEVLRLRADEDTPSWFLEFVANVNDFQEDWHRRLRELRSLGIEYSFKKTRLSSGKVETSYKLVKWNELPADPRAEIARVEKDRRKT
jgi:hypothetical protein